jgi:hypothetical protein
MAECFINCDEAGRAELLAALLRLCVELPYAPVPTTEDEEREQGGRRLETPFNDVFYRTSMQGL